MRSLYVFAAVVLFITVGLGVSAFNHDALLELMTEAKVVYVDGSPDHSIVVFKGTEIAVPIAFMRGTD